MFTDEQAQRLEQWQNVYGWTTAQCVAAAESDETLRRLLDAEMRADLSNDALAIRDAITKVEPCHSHLLSNVERILRMIGEMRPDSVLGCGEIDPGVVEALRATLAETAAWIDGRMEDAGAMADTLGERIPAKQWLAACLCKTLVEQLAGVPGVEPLPGPDWP